MRLGKSLIYQNRSWCKKQRIELLKKIANSVQD